MAVKPLVGAQLDRTHPLAQGLAGLWLMNEGSGLSVYDYSGNDNHGVLTGDPTWGAGPDGGALDLTDDYAEVASPVIDFSSGISIVVRAKLAEYAGTSVSPDWGQSAIIESGDATRVLHGLMVYGTSNGKAQGYVNWDSAIAVANRKRVTGATTVSLGVWHQIAMTYNLGQVALYLDGVMDGSADFAVAPYATTRARIGRLLGTIQGYWSGGLSELVIYTRGLTADEVAWLYAEPYCMFTRPDRWLRVFDFGATVVGRAYFGTRNLGAQLLRRTGL